MPTITRCRIASDVDFLSRVQLEEVCNELKKHCPKLGIETIIAGEEASDNNRAPNSPIRVARLMNDLMNGAFDGLVLNATHLPARLPNGLTLGAVTNRLIPYDVLISSLECLLDELDEGSSIIANDERREAQLLYYRPDLKMVRTRGSVDSVIQKVQSRKVDAAVLAAGDVERLQKQDHVVEFLTCSICIPAAGQGSLAILVRSNDEPAKRSIHSINDPASYSEIVAEWAFLDALGVEGGSPVGVLGSIEGKTLELEGMVALPDGRERIHALTKGTLGHEAELGEKLAAEILNAGGRELLQELDLV